MWAKLDDNFPDHPKVIAAGPLAAWLFVGAVCFCNRYLTDGYVPRTQLRRLADFDGVAVDLEELAATLVRVGLWEPADGGYRVHDFLEYNPSADDVRRERASTARRQADWRARRNGVTESADAPSAPVTNGVSNAISNGPVTPAPSRPDPLRSRPDPDPDPDLAAAAAAAAAADNFGETVSTPEGNGGTSDEPAAAPSPPRPGPPARAERRLTARFGPRWVREAQRIAVQLRNRDPTDWRYIGGICQSWTDAGHVAPGDEPWQDEQETRAPPPAPPKRSRGPAAEPGAGGAISIGGRYVLTRAIGEIAAGAVVIVANTFKGRFAVTRGGSSRSEWADARDLRPLQDGDAHAP